MRVKLKQLHVLSHPRHSAEITSESQRAKSRGKYKQGYRNPMVAWLKSPPKALGLYGISTQTPSSLVYAYLWLTHIFSYSSCPTSEFGFLHLYACEGCFGELKLWDLTRKLNVKHVLNPKRGKSATLGAANWNISESATQRREGTTLAYSILWLLYT